MRIATRVSVLLVLAFPLLTSVARSAPAGDCDGFGAPVVYGVGDAPVAVAVGDLDNDGDLDAVVVNGADRTYQVLENDGVGNFSVGTPRIISISPTEVYIVDVDRDGDRDIVTNDKFRDEIVFARNLGTGSFSNPILIPTGFDPESFVIDDVNGDGELDIAVAALLPGSGRVVVHLGNGDFTFQPPQFFLAGDKPAGITLGDVDRDGDPDIAVSNRDDGTVSVLKNIGGGNFSAPDHYAVGGSPRSLTLGDFNGDQRPDLAVTNLNPTTVTILLNAGAGSFTSPVAYDTSPGLTQAVVDIDLDADGALDLVVSTNGGTYVMKGLGDGTFEDGVEAIGQAGVVLSTGVGDLNGDQAPDLVAGVIPSDEAWVAFNDCSGAGLAVRDPNPDSSAMGLSGIWVSSEVADPESLALPAVNGFVSDGETLVLPTLTIADYQGGNVEFSIAEADNPAATGIGRLHPVSGPLTGTTSITVAPTPGADGRASAVCVWEAPEDFDVFPGHANQWQRELDLTAQYRGTIVSRRIRLRRPPVLLLHGLWSGPETWTCWFDDDPRFIVERGAYPNSAAFADNVGRQSNVVRREIRDALQRARQLPGGYAATQTDVIGHSMGGVLTRLYAAEWNGTRYFRVDNRMRGDVNRLIGVASPFGGSPFATFLVAFTELTDIGFWLDVLLDIDGGALGDLRTNAPHFSDADPAFVPSHVVVAAGGPAYLAQEGGPPVECEDVGTRGLRFLLNRVNPVLVFGPETHDLIVAEPSQEADLLASESTQVAFAPPVCGLHTTMTNGCESGYVALFEMLLTAPVGGPLYATSIGNVPAPAPSAPGLPPARGTADLTIASPPAGVTLSPGDTLSVEVDVPAGIDVASMMISSTRGVFEISGPPFVVSITVDLDHAGDYDLAAGAFDTNGDFHRSDRRAVSVVPTTPLESFSVAPETVELFDFARSTELSVRATFGDGVERDVTSPTSGTTYSSDDASIAIVSPTGKVSAVSAGETIVRVMNGGVESAVDVFVLGVGCPAPEVFCARSPNFWTSGSRIDAVGSTDVAANDLTLLARDANPSGFGLFFYGQGRTQVPAGNGFFCVGGSLSRLPVTSTDSAGSASLDLDFSTLPSPIANGDTRSFQFWHRDIGGAAFNFSDAIEITFCAP